MKYIKQQNGPTTYGALAFMTIGIDDFEENPQYAGIVRWDHIYIIHSCILVCCACALLQ